MSAIVITTANWRADHCPRCGVSLFGRYSPVTWHTSHRGMCSRGHFVALVIDPIVVTIEADITKFKAAIDAYSQEAK